MLERIIVGVVSLSLYTVSTALMNCDNEIGTHCLTAGSLIEQVDCLASVDPSNFNSECLDWYLLMSSCSTDFQPGGICYGQESDAYLCLTAWHKREELSLPCQVVRPEPVEEEARDDTPKRKRDPKKKTSKQKRSNGPISKSFWRWWDSWGEQY